MVRGAGRNFKVEGHKIPVQSAGKIFVMPPNCSCAPPESGAEQKKFGGAQ